MPLYGLLLLSLSFFLFPGQHIGQGALPRYLCPRVQICRACADFRCVFFILRAHHDGESSVCHPLHVKWHAVHLFFIVFPILLFHFFHDLGIYLVAVLF